MAESQRLHAVPNPAESADLGPRREITQQIKDDLAISTLFLDSNQAVAIPLDPRLRGAMLVPKNEKQTGVVIQAGVVAYMNGAVPTKPDLATNDMFSQENLLDDLTHQRATMLEPSGIAGAARMPYHTLKGLGSLSDVALGAACELAAEIRPQSAIIGNLAFFSQPDAETAQGYTFVRDPDMASPVAGITFDVRTGQVGPLPLSEELLQDIADEKEGTPPLLGWMSIEMVGETPVMYVAGKDYCLGNENDSWPCTVFNTTTPLEIVDPGMSVALRSLKNQIVEMRGGEGQVAMHAAEAVDTSPADSDLEEVEDLTALFRGSFAGIVINDDLPGVSNTNGFRSAI